MHNELPSSDCGQSQARQHRRPSRPPGYKLLCKYLLDGRTESEVLDSIANGIVTSLKNARRLARGVDCLISVEHYASASVLAVTVEEELAKVLLLMDLAKLDFIRHEGTRTELCRAFCSHVDKYARFWVYRWRVIVDDLDRLRRDILFQKIDWFPADGEAPDLRGSAGFRRDESLYADIGEGGWYAPADYEHVDYFKSERGNRSEWQESVGILEQFERNLSGGLLSAEVLGIVHAIFKPVYVRGGSEQRVASLQQELADVLIFKQITDPGCLNDADILFVPPTYAWIGKSLDVLRREVDN